MMTTDTTPAAIEALMKDVTPGSKWRVEGKPDPHGARYDCPRSALPMADLSDDEMANGVYLFGDHHPPVADLLSGKAKTPGMWLDAAKNRIRWLSRKLDALRDLVPALAAERDAARQERDAMRIERDEWIVSATANHPNPADFRYWEGRYRDEKAEAAALRDEVARMKGLADRKKFPILGERGVSVDWQLVADHGGQANTNHGQTVARLAERGGLSWCELFAVLHNRRWEKMDTNDAMIACRALETRYLAALTSKGGEG